MIICIDINKVQVCKVEYPKSWDFIILISLREKSPWPRITKDNPSMHLNQETSFFPEKMGVSGNKGCGLSGEGRAVADNHLYE